MTRPQRRNRQLARGPGDAAKSHQTLPYVLLAAVVAGTALAGCTSGPEKPKPIEHDKPMPTCDALPPILISLGMSRPEPRPPALPGPPATHYNCSFSLPEPITEPGIASASVDAVRPNTDPFGTVRVERYGEIFVDSMQCEGLTRPVPSLPLGTICYEPYSENSGSALLMGFTGQVTVRIWVLWWEPDTSQAAIRVVAEQKADELAQQVITLL
ncbi:hypothetical protein ACN28C_29580 [Plantactinospora sp. WMMC1484]|uniref:hypothetical protein n=1 Tax=Plantactinospora sp. WMMC1484 TaxID=3404122 RepID=UPI003BF559EF